MAVRSLGRRTLAFWWPEWQGFAIVRCTPPLDQTYVWSLRLGWFEVREAPLMAGKRSSGAPALVPAAARAGRALTPLEATLNGEAIEVFTKAVGGRPQLAAVLAISGVSSDIERIAGLLVDPRYTHMSLRRICTYAGITVADLFLAYRKALVARAHIEATHIIASKLPPIVEDVMTRATPQRMLCPKCLGTSAAGQGPCPLCESTGVVQSEPDLDRQKLALELGQLTEKKGGILMQQNTIAAGVLASTGSGALEQLHQAVGDLLFSPTRRRAGAPPPIVDAEPLDDTLDAATDPPRIPRADRNTDDTDRDPDPLADPGATPTAIPDVDDRNTLDDDEFDDDFDFAPDHDPAPHADPSVPALPETGDASQDPQPPEAP